MPKAKAGKHSKRMRIIRITLFVWLVLTGVWTLLLVPSLMLWINSTPWIVVMSWWANVSASAANFTAAYMMLMQMKENSDAET